MRRFNCKLAEKCIARAGLSLVRDIHQTPRPPPPISNVVCVSGLAATVSTRAQWLLHNMWAETAQGCATHWLAHSALDQHL
jgi:hypothetical protein